jgi:hypothetical protein
MKTVDFLLYSCIFLGYADVYHDIVEIENKHELFYRRLARKRQKHIGPKTFRTALGLYGSQGR